MLCSFVFNLINCLYLDSLYVFLLTSAGPILSPILGAGGRGLNKQVVAKVNPPQTK